jgi:hypothetical protein
MRNRYLHETVTKEHQTCNSPEDPVAEREPHVELDRDHSIAVIQIQGMVLQ